MYDFYHFSAQVGHTDWGDVYLGRDKRTEEAVAIMGEDKTKLPLQNMMILTKRDMSVVNATQTHEAIVKVIDIFESTKRFYTVTELVSGGTLEEAMRRNSMSESGARCIMRDLLRGLEHLHMHEVVHGSVDSEHIVCCRREFPCAVKLVGYGTAVGRRDSRLLGPKGDFGHAAPEVVCFQRRSAASDVFSAGVLLFRLLSGVEPFPMGQEAAYLRRVSQGAKFGEGIWENVSESVKELLVRMLGDEASGRPGAAECLDCEWFREGLSDADAGDEMEDGREQNGMEEVGCDPKTVMVEYEGEDLQKVCVGGALSRRVRFEDGSTVEDVSYAELD